MAVLPSDHILNIGGGAHKHWRPTQAFNADAFDQMGMSMIDAPLAFVVNWYCLVGLV